jgi:hypothetical protein
MTTNSRPRPSGRAPLARYSNYFEVGHNPYEFLIDFGQYQPESATVVLHTRIALGPTLAKVLHDMLRDAVVKYEAEHGEIRTIDDAQDPLRVLLQSLPDFEHRAVSARQRPLPEPTPATKRTPRKR